MKDAKNLTIGALATALIVGGGYALVNDDTATSTDAVATSTPMVIEVEGTAGPRGYAGPAGPAGTNGINGTNGTNGTNATVNLDVLVDAVIDEMEDREDRVDYSYSGHSGSFTRTLNINDADNYKFTIKHFGSGDVDVSMEDENGDVVVFVDSDGHINYTDTRSLNDEEYKLHISADGNWTIEVEQK